MSREELDRFIAQEPLFAQTKVFQRTIELMGLASPPTSVPLVPQRKSNWVQWARRRLERT